MDRHQALARQQHLGHGAGIEVECAGHEPILVVVEQTLATGLLDQSGNLVVAEGRGDLVLGLDPQQPDHQVGDRVEDYDERLEDRDDRQHERTEDQRGAIGADEGEVLRHHLAEDHMGEDDDRHRDHEGHGVDQALRQRDPFEDRLEQVRNRRFPDRTQPERAEGDAQLGGRHDLTDVLHGPQRKLGRTGAGSDPRLHLRAPGRDQRELGCDEQGVEREQNEGQDQSPPRTHDSSPPSVKVPTEVIETRSMR